MKRVIALFLLALELIIAVYMVNQSFRVKDTGDQVFEVGFNELGGVASKVLESDKLKYNGTKITGRDLVSTVLPKYLPDQTMEIIVITKANKSGSTVTGTSYTKQATSQHTNLTYTNATGVTGTVALTISNSYNIVDTHNDNYINLRANFTGELLYNANDSIDAMLFIQE